MSGGTWKVDSMMAAMNAEAAPAAGPAPAAEAAETGKWSKPKA